MKPIVRNYQLTDEMVDTLLDRLERLRDDEDARAIGQELARQQNFNPNHEDDIWSPPIVTEEDKMKMRIHNTRLNKYLDAKK